MALDPHYLSNHLSVIAKQTFSLSTLSHDIFLSPPLIKSRCSTLELCIKTWVFLSFSCFEMFLGELINVFVVLSESGKTVTGDAGTSSIALTPGAVTSANNISPVNKRRSTFRYVPLAAIQLRLLLTLTSVSVLWFRLSSSGSCRRIGMPG